MLETLPGAHSVCTKTAAEPRSGGRNLGLTFSRLLVLT